MVSGTLLLLGSYNWELRGLCSYESSLVNKLLVLKELVRRLITKGRVWQLFIMLFDDFLQRLKIGCSPSQIKNGKQSSFNVLTKLSAITLVFVTRNNCFTVSNI